MKTFQQYLTEAKKKKPTYWKPLTLYHGTKADHNQLEMPNHYYQPRAADGHAIYITDQHDEAKSYGHRVFQLRLNGRKSRFLQLDKPLHQQPGPVKNAIRKITPELAHLLKPPPANKKKWSDDHRRYNGDGGTLCWRLDLHKKHEPIAASQVLYQHGVLGGVGESLFQNSKGKDQTSNVYSVYHPSVLKIVKAP